MSLLLWCPFPSAINPLASQLNTQTALWARGLRLVKSEKETERLLRSKVGYLVARGFPGATEEHLQLISDWTAYFCLLDDYIDAPGMHPLSVSTFLASLISVVEGEPSAKQSEPLTAALLDLQARMRSMCSHEWLSCFTERVKDLFTAFSWESFYRYSKTTPDLKTYLRLRQVTVGIQMELLFGDLLTPQPVTNLARMASNLIGWQNDIFTYEKELEQGETLNLIIVLMRTEELSRREAEARAIALHNEEVARFLEEMKSHPQDPGQLEAAMHWVRGHLEWAQETGRYRPTSQALPEEKSLAV